MLISRRDEVVPFIEQNNLWIDAQALIRSLVRCELEPASSDARAIAMLVAHTDAIPVGPLPPSGR